MEEIKDEVRTKWAGFPLPKAGTEEIKSIIAYGDGDIVMKYGVLFFNGWVTKRSYIEKGDK